MEPLKISKNRPVSGTGQAKTDVGNRDSSNTTTSSSSAPSEDRCSFSREAIQFLRSQSVMTQQRTTLVDLLFGRKKDSQEDTAIKARKIAVQCAKIAAQIRKGNKVDPEDLRYLRKHDPQLYLMAMTMRKPNDDPEKCKRISREDPSQNTVGSLQIVQHNSSGESVPVMPSQPKATE